VCVVSASQVAGLVCLFLLHVLPKVFVKEEFVLVGITYSRLVDEEVARQHAQ